jgi:hypothetical protein
MPLNPPAACSHPFKVGVIRAAPDSHMVIIRFSQRRALGLVWPTLSIELKDIHSQ